MKDVVNSNETEPLYQQLKKIILDGIKNKELIQDQKIPSESQLSKEYKISRITVRKALNELVYEGYLIRKQGKGTYVSKVKFERNFEELVGYSQSMIHQGYKPGRIIINKKIIDVDPMDARKTLNLGVSDKMIFIKSLLLADGEPIVVEKTYFSIKYALLLDEDLNNKSIYQIIKTKLNIIPSKAVRTVSIDYADKEIANYLITDEKRPLFVVSELVFDEQNNPIHHSFSYALSSKTKIQMTAYANNNNGAGVDYVMVPS